MKKKPKGISPLVAVIMLIAFTMIIAGILAGWATRFASEQRANLELCVRANMIIRSASYANNNVTLMLYNAGTVPLRGFNVQVTYDTGGPPLPDTWEIKEQLEANTFQTFSHELANISVSYIEVRSVQCQGAYDMIRGYDIIGLP